MRSRVLGLSIGSLALAGACVTSNRSLGSSGLSEASAPEAYTKTLGSADIDSMVAQAAADREGPRVDIRAIAALTSGSARRLRGSFRVEDDAYVLVGHVDADGTVRIVFPQDPKDDGFVRGGNRSYQTSEFFAGFEDAYRFRYATYGRYGGFQQNAYDGAGGHLFIVASWRPMHFDKFMGEDGSWDSFEITDARYQNPEPAIQELAALLAGENREAYTLKFARYSTSMNYAGFSTASGHAFGLGSCNTYGMYGWQSTMSWMAIAPVLLSSTYNDVFYYRGNPYLYDSLLGCAVRLPYAINGYRYSPLAQPPRIGQGPGAGTGPGVGRTRMLSAEDSPRDPITPRPQSGRFAPASPRDGNGTGNAGLPVQVSTQYRQRGLITEDEPRAVPGGRAPRVGLGEEGAPRRPGIVQMTERRTEDNRGMGRARYGSDNGEGNQRNEPYARRTNAGNDGSQPQPRTRPVPRDAERYAPRGESPRAPEQSYQPRVQNPAIERPSVERPVAAPAAMPVQAAPRSEPASSPGSSPAGKPTPPPTL